MTDRGGYACPVKWCPYRAVVPSLIRQHIRETHPEESPK